MINTMNLLIRADAGPAVGTGHVMRMVALGQAWARQSGKVAFACGPLPNGLIARIQAEDFDVFKLDNSQCDAADAEETLELALQLQPGWIALDGYQFDMIYQSILRESASKILLLDDDQQPVPSNSNLVVNQNVYATQSAYQNLSSNPDFVDNSFGNPPISTKVLAGPKYALLRSEFLSELIQPKHTVKEARRILVTFGGADPDNWTLRTLNVLSNLKRKNLIVDCVVGACFSHTRELELFKKEANLSLRMHRNVDHMSHLMTRADMAISAGGSTCYELARCGVPTLLVSIADNQVPVAQALNESGIMISVDHGQQKSDDSTEERANRLGVFVKKLLSDSELRATMKKNATKLVDGQGATRICEQMLQSQFSFRKVNANDAKQLWHWRNDPEVRSVSFSQEAIPLESHQKWLGQKIHDPETRILICETEAGEAIGQVRFDLDGGGSRATISIIVDQSVRGRGIGKTMIKQTCTELFETSGVDTVLAQIKTGNTASEKAFRSAGFEAIEPAVIQGNIALQYRLSRANLAENLPLRAVKKSA